MFFNDSLMQPIKIVNLKDCPSHLQQIAEWHQAEWAYLNPGQTLQDRVEKMQAYLDGNFIPTTYIALAGDELLGSAAIIECDMETRQELTPWLASVYVEETARRKGIGTALVRHVSEQARLHGFDSIFLYTPDQEKFYQARGWSVLEHVPYHGAGVTIMQQHL